MKPIDFNRLLTGFNEIQEFIEQNNRAPKIESQDFWEQRLAVRLHAIKGNDSLCEPLAPYDKFGILT